MNAKEILLKILDKQEDFNKEIATVKIILARQEENLEEHMRRTQLNEENLELLRSELKPVQRHVDMINGVLKLIGGIAVVVSIITGVLAIISQL